MFSFYRGQLILASGQNVIDTIKCTTLRDMTARNALTRYLMAKLASVPSGSFPKSLTDVTAGLTLEERALHLQGVFFHTGCVQMSEAMAHACLAIASYPNVYHRLACSSHDTPYWDWFISEVLRVYVDV